MRLVFLGPPGVGKGTQAKFLAERKKLVHVSTGDILREAVAQGTPIGMKAKRYMQQGLLVPDQLVVEIVTERISVPDCSRGFILDGFPRTVPQAEALDRFLDARGQRLDAVVNFHCSPESLVKRLSGRHICKSCGANFHLKFNPPMQEGRCDRCQGVLYQRPDDRPETITERLAVYHRQTETLIDYYRKQGILVSVPAEGTIDQVSKILHDKLKIAARD
jgi:adenylate kinase